MLTSHHSSLPNINILNESGEADSKILFSQITFLHEPGVYWYSWPQAQTLENFISTNGRNVIGALMDGAILDLAHQLQDAKVMISESQRILARKQHRLCSRLEKITSPVQSPGISQR